MNVRPRGRESSGYGEGRAVLEQFSALGINLVGNAGLAATFHIDDLRQPLVKSR